MFWRDKMRMFTIELRFFHSLSRRLSPTHLIESANCICLLTTIIMKLFIQYASCVSHESEVQQTKNSSNNESRFYAKVSVTTRTLVSRCFLTKWSCVKKRGKPEWRGTRSGMKIFMNVLPSYFPGIKCLILHSLWMSFGSNTEHNHSLATWFRNFFSSSLPLSVFTYSASLNRALSPCALNTLPQWLVSDYKRKIDIYLQFPCQNFSCSFAVGHLGAFNPLTSIYCFKSVKNRASHIIILIVRREQQGKRKRPEICSELWEIAVRRFKRKRRKLMNWIELSSSPCERSYQAEWIMCECVRLISSSKQSNRFAFMSRIKIYLISQ